MEKKIWKQYEEELIKNDVKCPECESDLITSTSLGELICLNCGYRE